MSLSEFLSLLTLPLGVATFLALATTFVLGRRMLQRKAKLPTHRAAARVAIVLATAHAASVLGTILL